MLRSSLFVTLVSVAALLCGCAAQEQQVAVSHIDDKTGESFTRAREAVHLIIARPGLSAVGKDYLFLSPVTANSSTGLNTYLWFALGSTIDRAIMGADTPSFETIVLVVDGTMMTFDLVPWSDIATAQPFDLSFNTRASFASRITRNQLSRIAAADTLEAYVTNAEHRSPLYLYSRGPYSDWNQF